MMGNYLTLDFGESYFRSISVIDLVLEKMPVSISLGLWSTLIAYLVSIPLGIRKAVKDGIKRFDTWTSGAIIVAYAIPGFLFAILLLVLFAGGLLLADLPAAGADLGQLGQSQPVWQDRRLLLAHHPAGHRPDDFGLCDADLADQELVSG